jgi:hypothetical protein
MQAAYDKACHLNQIQHAHQGANCKKAITEYQGFGASLWSAFPGCYITNFAIGQTKSKTIIGQTMNNVANLEGFIMISIKNKVTIEIVSTFQMT